MITIIGTNHISKDSLKQVDKARDADIIALELDKPRLEGLLSKEKSSKNPKIMFQIGVTGYLFLLIGGMIQQKLGKITGISPGGEMLYAYNIAKEQKKGIALIDQDIRITMKKFSKIKFIHKLKLLRELFRPAPKEFRFNPKTIPKEELIQKIMAYMKLRLPEMHRVLIDERNHVMAKHLAHLQFFNPEKNIAAVLGAGHVREVAELSKNYLKQLNNNSV